MVRELPYETIGDVVETWELAKQYPGFEDITALAILEKYDMLNLPETTDVSARIFKEPLVNHEQSYSLHSLVLFFFPFHSQSRLFEIEPRTRIVFGLPPAAKEDASNIRKSALHRMGILIHAKRMVNMLDSVFALLGPDMDSLTEILGQLGKRHTQYGVKASYIPFMGKAIISTLKELLHEKGWNDRVEESWVTVYDELGDEIMRAILAESERSNRK